MARRSNAAKVASRTSKKRGTPENAENSAPKHVKRTVTKAAKSAQKKPARPKTAPTPSHPLNVAPTTRLEVFVFGAGSSGELGLGVKNSTDVGTPRLNRNLDPESVGVVNLDAGGMHAVALTHDNKVLTWGGNDDSALGRDTAWESKMRDIDAEDDSDSDSDLNPRESTPTAVPADKFPAGTKFVQVVAGDSSTFVLTEEGLVYGWGIFRDSNGKFGFSLTANNEVIETQVEPLLIPRLHNITQLSAGNDFCLALDAEGSVFAWGNGQQNELGRRLLERRRMFGLLPTPVALPKKRIVSVYAGANHAFAIDKDGNTWGWGSNNFAQTGITDGAGEGGSTVIKPQKVPSLVGKDMKMVQGGSHHSIGITHSGECLVWGRIDGAQLGRNITHLVHDDPEAFMIERGKPRILLKPTLLPITGCTYGAAGSDHNVVTTSEGKAYSWGFNATYQCGQGTDDDIPIATLIAGAKVRDKKLIWAGAGGQYSMLASVYDNVGLASGPPLPNGIHAA